MENQTRPLTKWERMAYIVAGISEQIRADLRELDSEERHPGSGPDESDDCITDLRGRIIALRQVRQDVEHIFSGTTVMPPKIG